MFTPRDFAIATWVTRQLLVASVGETVTVLSLCLDPINMNSVLVIFRVSLVKESLQGDKVVENLELYFE